MKKLRILFLALIAMLLACFGFACGDERDGKYKLTVNDPMGHIITHLESDYEAGEEITLKVHDAYSGIRVILYLDGRALRDYEPTGEPFTFTYRFTMPNHDATLSVSPPYPGGENGGNSGNSGNSSNTGNSESSGDINSGEEPPLISTDSTPGIMEVNSATFRVHYDYGFHVEGQATMLLSGIHFFFSPTEYKVPMPLLAGDELTVYYTGTMFIEESYPGNAGFEGGSVHWVEKTRSARLYPIFCQDGELYTADGAPLMSTHEYVVNADGTCTKIADLPDGAQLYGSSTETYGCEVGESDCLETEIPAPQRYHAIYSYHPEAPIKSTEILPWLSILQPADVLRIDSEIYNYGVAINDFVQIQSIVSQTEISRFVYYLKALVYSEIPQEEGLIDGGGTAEYTLYTNKGVKKYSTYAGCYFDGDKVYKPYEYPPALQADEVSYRFKRCGAESLLYVNGEYKKDYGTLLQEIVFKPYFPYVEAYVAEKYVLNGYDMPIYLLDEKIFWIEEGFQKGVYKIVGDRDFSEIFEDYPLPDFPQKTYSLQVIGDTDVLLGGGIDGVYRAGETLTIQTRVLMDAVVVPYLNGEMLSIIPSADTDGDSFSFVMPNRDSVLFINVENGFIPPTENVKFTSQSVEVGNFDYETDRQPRLLSTWEEFKAYIESFEDGDKDVMQSACVNYDEEYFTKNSLIVLSVMASSGSFLYNTRSITITYDDNYRDRVCITLEEMSPDEGEGTADIKHWQIVIAVGKYNRIEKGQLELKEEFVYKEYV